MIELGIKGETERTVTKDLLADQIGSGLVKVFATPMMIAGIEQTAASSVQPFCGEGKTTVGVHMDVSHDAATPEGMKVRFTSELTDISANGKILTFKVDAFDEAGLIGQGTHKRAIVDKARFEERTQAKLSK